MDIKKITHLIYRISAKSSGLKKDEVDSRDFQTGIFKWGAYTPKETRKINPTMSIKDQNGYNTCQWNATVVQKEPDENMVGSVRRLVSYGKRNGMVSGDGFSSLRSGQVCLKDYGLEPATNSSENAQGWEDYSNSSLNMAEAAKHKTQSFWQVSSKSDLLKVIDEGRIVVTGMEWFTAFNQGGGFSSPWIITKSGGYSIGGHAFDNIGYDMAYHGREVAVMQNSYGDKWGDNGKFYVDLSYFMKNNWGLWVNLDIAPNTGAFLNKYDGVNVKGSGSTIWLIQKGMKKVYPDWVTYLAFNGLVRGFTQLTKEEEDVLKEVKNGDNMDITKSIYWDFIKNLKDPENLHKLLEILNKQ